ncbi:serine/threonine-protein phosphatase 6 regulatory ankyrin repeat subunit B-like, partial [Lineus longissimus]|uniref:serine/threonine-protein phosphatase 6 regulatory ankyrin repeat subunit B-like n=1 Tax=Lineus longissimus TaxID=88925 RepID=UPI00315C80D9
SPFSYAAEGGNIDVVRLLIENKADVHATDNEGRSPLSYAAQGGNIDVVRLLIENKADVHATDNEGRSPLSYAAEGGNIDVVRLLIENKADVHATDKKGSSPLSYAARGGNIDVVRLLIENKADVHATDNEGRSPLSYAARGGNIDVVRLLIENKADVHATDKKGSSPLSYAVQRGDYGVVRLLIENKADVNAIDNKGRSPLSYAARGGNADVNATDKAGRSPLSYAVRRGDYGVVRLLIENKADVNAIDNKDDDGSSPLSYAAEEGNIDVVRLLIENKADVHATDNKGRSPLSYAAEEGNIDVVRLLIENKADVNATDNEGSSPLSHAVQGGNIDVVRLLIENKADVHATDNEGRSPLSHAVQGGNIDVVRLLIENKADVHATDNKGRSPLSYAAGRGNIDVVRLLIENKADVHATDNKGRSPLLYAAMRGHIDVVRLFIENKADVNATDNEGRSPLSYVAEGGNIDVVRLLIENKAGVNATDNEGRSPLSYAAGRGYIDVVRLLIKNKADVNATDNEGRSPLSYAAGRGYIDVVRLLIENKADVDATDNEGRSPLSYAVQRGNIDVVRLLIENKADVNAKDSGGLKLLSLATQNKEIFDELIRCGTEIDVSDQRGLSNLHIGLASVSESLLYVLEDTDDSHDTHEPRQKKEKTVNAPGSYDRTMLHVAATLGLTKHMSVLLRYRGINVNACDIFSMTCLHYATIIGNEDIIRNLLKADFGALDTAERSVLHIAAIYGHCKSIETITQIQKDLLPHVGDKQGRNCLHYAVIYRRDEVVKLLLNNQPDSQINYSKDNKGKKPIDYLYKFEENTLIWKLFGNQSPVIKIIYKDTDLSCHKSETNLLEVSKQCGIGSVKRISGFDLTTFAKQIKSKVEEVIREAIPESGNVEVIGCGSSFEGSKVGLPDELDFMVKLYSVYKQKLNREGYGEMARDKEMTTQLNIDNTPYGIWLWNRLMIYWSEHQRQKEGEHQRTDHEPQFQMPLPPVRHPDHTTCTTWIWLYSDSMFKDLAVSIDFVPAIEIKDYGRARCFIVPKIPHKESIISKTFTTEELNQLGRISHPTMEVELLLNLDQHLMDVFITAKSLRKPEVCGFKMKNDKDETVPMGEYITSYRLKTSFMHLIEVFQVSKMSLGKMVLIVYEYLEKCLQRGDLPSFSKDTWGRPVNVLEGSRLSKERSILAATKMTEFVRCLYERDFSSVKDLDLKEQQIVERKLGDIFDGRQNDHDDWSLSDWMFY